jgi:2-dehydro-3-deoxyphosphogluconate aldolase / (4S)-4-hydroxy-2-oxoglutarate aldolase
MALSGTGSAAAQTAATIRALGVVAIVRITDRMRLRAAIDAIGEGGVSAIEITMTVPNAIDVIRELAQTLPSTLLGAGTVLDVATARAALDAGARFVVSPILSEALLEEATRHDAPIIPGCFSPTEIVKAVDAGASLVKVFPATSLGPGYIRDLRGPFPALNLIPTGGVTPDNAGDWIRAGAAAVGVGTALLDAAAVASGGYDVLRANAERLVGSVRAARDAR